ncbi:MAG: hypothetical protein F6K40_08555 [Okeania sp. SIO3I5]|uniref:hypothetical protein n=1 Tax=Okeania sp. SIO3I5 TaxID=2607805 RepID=UPI0013B94C23|nr:hypothetical protein [Okeania sp. SIO3I5]NEQ36329.1 hypothetical protein [Okeania sp. SIO3I5]
MNFISTLKKQHFSHLENFAQRKLEKLSTLSDRFKNIELYFYCEKAAFFSS